MPVRFTMVEGQKPAPRISPATVDQALAKFIERSDLTLDDVRAAIAAVSTTSSYVRDIVGPREFCISPYYMNPRRDDGTLELYPITVDTIEEICAGGYEEVVLTGGIGAFKTTVALYCLAYQLYLLSCLRSPHDLYGLDSATEIVMIFQSLNARVASMVDFERFKAMIDRSPYFRRYFQYDKSRKSDLRFPNRIVVTPTATTISGAIGQNLIGGLIDEINFMLTVEKSRRSVDNTAFDQAKTLYEIIDRRRRSRFMKQGKLPGLLCMSSSKHYPGEFTDKKMEERDRELERHGKSTIYVYHKRVWDVKPQDFAASGHFKVFIGDESRKPHVLEDGETYAEEDAHLIDTVPLDFLSKYEEDIYGALRDFSGAATASRHPFILNVDMLGEAFGATPSILNLTETDFSTTKLEFFPKLFRNRVKKRWVHIDLGLTSDAAGAACGFIKDFETIKRGDQVEILPNIELDFVLRIKPPKNGEILFYKLRELIYLLKQHGLPIRWVSFDSYQSADSIQTMRTRGYVTGEISMDRTSVPYDFTKTAFYDKRLRAPRHDHCQSEFTQLERDPKTGKIDHRPLGSKDTADAVAGVVYGLTTRRELWVEAGVPLKLVPDSISTAISREQDAKRGHTKGERNVQQRQVTTVSSAN